MLNFKNKILGTFSLEVAGASWGCSLLLLFKCCSESSSQWNMCRHINTIINFEKKITTDIWKEYVSINPERKHWVDKNGH